MSFATFFTSYYRSRLSVGESISVSFVFELLKLIDNYLHFSGGCHLDQLDIATLINRQHCAQCKVPVI